MESGGPLIPSKAALHGRRSRVHASLCLVLKGVKAGKKGGLFESFVAFFLMSLLVYLIVYANPKKSSLLHFDYIIRRPLRVILLLERTHG
jgi:uncharacterized integral membrane protein